MRDAFIVSALRTPIGKKKGTLSSMHPADLGAVVPVSYTHLRAHETDQ